MVERDQKGRKKKREREKEQASDVENLPVVENLTLVGNLTVVENFQGLGLGKGHLRRFLPCFSAEADNHET